MSRSTPTITYRYDGSFEGFLCAVGDCLDLGENQQEFKPGNDSF